MNTDIAKKKRTFHISYDPASEEAWLQKMADQGWALEGVKHGLYTFRQCEPGTYTARIALLKTHKERAHVEEMLTDSGAIICPIKPNPLPWIYAIRDKSLGDFEINSTAQDKARSDWLHLKRLRLFWVLALVIATLVIIFTPGILHGKEIELTDFFTGFAVGIALSLVITVPAYLKIRKRLKSYKDDSGIYAD
ncbi:MAG: DUF2812 domain-containing protein [Actinomycetaceae bacterium]|nr:DUF2812 domain-containing protein [Actinomycetaceae bacterium]